MRPLTRWIPVALLVAALVVVVGLAANSDSETSGDAAADGPARVEAVRGTSLSRVRLSEDAARRTGIETTAVRRAPGGATAVPYSAIIYEAAGQAWVYTAPEPLAFVRSAVEVETVEGDRALLSSGPPPGTVVVSVGAAELFGEELGVGK